MCLCLIVTQLVLVLQARWVVSLSPRVGGELSMVFRVIFYNFSKWICVQEKLGRFLFSIGDLKMIYYEHL